MSVSAGRVQNLGGRPLGLQRAHTVRASGRQIRPSARRAVCKLAARRAAEPAQRLGERSEASLYNNGLLWGFLRKFPFVTYGSLQGETDGACQAEGSVFARHNI